MRHVGCGDREGAVLSWLLINRDTSYIYYLLLRILLFSKIVLKTYSIYFHFFYRNCIIFRKSSKLGF